MSEAQTPHHQTAELRVFSYAVADKSDLYVAVVEALTLARERFRLQLRPSELVRDLRVAGLDPSAEEVGAALEQLAAWGNVTHFYDSSAPETLAEFYSKRYLYQLTQAGWTAHEGVRKVRSSGLGASGRLSGVLLPAIVERLEALRVAGEERPRDGARLLSLFTDLFAVFGEFADNSARYMSDLSVQVSDLAADDDRFLAYKQAVLAYLNDFVARFAEMLPRIQSLVKVLEGTAGTLQAAAAESDTAPTLAGPDQSPLDDLHQKWSGVTGWFLAADDQVPVAESLRFAMLEALNRILMAVGRLNERHLRRASREADFLQLARWFATLDDAGAHALWDRAFGLWGARHFFQTAGDEEVERRRSFWEAEPADIAPRLRATGRRAQAGRPGTGADYRAVKLARVAAMRALHAQAAAAAGRLAGCTPARLSDLRELDHHEFAQFLALVDAALSVRPQPDGSRAAATPLVSVRLRPVPGDHRATIRTPSGKLDCPDQILSIFLAQPADAQALA